MFGTSGIRGTANDEVTAELALHVGNACGSRYDSIVVGHDPRTSSQMLHSAITAGALAAGASVTDVGLVSTPTLAYAAWEHDIGVMITASHNPPEYNGIKLFNPDGAGFSIEQSDEIETVMQQQCRAAWNDIKNVQMSYSAIEEHMAAILDAVPPVERPFKVVVDCGCGATGTITPYLLQKLGCQVVALNAQPDGFFPAHAPEPVPENLDELMQLVAASDADLGLAHDCDGDRVVAVTSEGTYVPNDRLLALLARHLCPAGRIAVPVDTSLVVDAVLPDASITRTRVGDIYISAELKKRDGDFGGEPSGTFVFPSFSYCPDGVYAAAVITSLAAEMSLEDELASMPDYELRRGAVSSTRDKITAGMPEIEREMADLDFADLTTIDGIRIARDDRWALVRPSGTEPKVRVTVEASRQEHADELYEQLMTLVRRCLT
ncbi:MAG: phosphoglucosamine mutase [Thermoplasmatota archaeon]